MHNGRQEKPKGAPSHSGVVLRPETAFALARRRGLLLFNGFLVRDVLAAALALHFLRFREGHLGLLELVRQVRALLLELVQFGRVLRRRVLVNCLNTCLKKEK